MARAARQTSIDPTQIQIVHVWNRCVRRAFLCGQDPLTGKDYEHRRDWARQRLEHLASVFAIDCITFSIMSNHSHQILRSRPDVVAQWDDCEVALRWLRLTPKLDQRGNALEPTEDQIKALCSRPESHRQDPGSAIGCQLVDAVFFTPYRLPCQQGGLPQRSFLGVAIWF